MDYDIKYRVQNSEGSFTAWGVGIQYEYNADKQTLDLTDAKSGAPISYVDTSRSCKDKALEFAHLIDKISQLYALNFSDNITIDLTEVLNGSRLGAILTTLSTTAMHAQYLKNHRFQKFNAHLNADFCTTRLLVRSKKETASANKIFTGSFKNKKGTLQASAQDAHLYCMLSKLSQAISTNIITNEIIGACNHSLENSIRISSELTTISAALNPQLKPIEQLNKTSAERKIFAQ